MLLLALLLALLPPASARSANSPVTFHNPQVVFSHTGVHTHANYLLFDTGKLDLLACQRDFATYPHLAIKAFCLLPTDHAALPPDLAAFSSPSDPPLANPYGPINGGFGKPGWTVLPLHQNGKNSARVLVPTRFVNWLAEQPAARRKLYLQPKCYTLQVRWGK